MFGQSRDIYKEVVLSSNIFGNMLDDLVNSSNKENIISYYTNKDVTSLGLLVIE